MKESSVPGVHNAHATRSGMKYARAPQHRCTPQQTRVIGLRTGSSVKGTTSGLKEKKKSSDRRSSAAAAWFTTRCLLDTHAPCVAICSPHDTCAADERLRWTLSTRTAQTLRAASCSAREETWSSVAHDK